MGWQEGDPVSVIQGVEQNITANVDILDRLAPGSATYFNEVILTDISSDGSWHTHTTALDTGIALRKGL